MNDTIPQENMQELTAEEAKASLGIATALMGQLMPQQTSETAETPQEQGENMNNAVDSPEQPDEVLERMDKIDSELAEIKQLLSTDEKAEILELKKQVETLMNEDGEE